MKKVLLFVILISSSGLLRAQHDIFMQIIENKKICNKEDELTYFLQANSYERNNENHYYHYYAEGGNQYYTLIVNDNECYVSYRTDNAKDYNKIKNAITNTCVKELAADKSASYVCNNKRVRDVQVIFYGYSQKDKYYEILVYQNPEQHEAPYNPDSRILPDADKTIVKKVKKHARKTIKQPTADVPMKAGATSSATTAPKVPVPAKTPAAKPATPKVTPPPPAKAPQVKVGTPSAPSVIKK